MALIGEPFLSASIQTLCDKIGSGELMDFFREKILDRSLLKKLKRTFLALDAVLGDAEKQMENPVLKKWLDELKHAVFEAEDLLDEIDTVVLRSKVEAEYQTKKTQAASAEWPFLLISLCLEILSVAFDQISSPSKPQYALFGMLLAIVGLLICVLEFIYKGIKGRVELRSWGKLWWFYYPPPPCYKPLGTVVEISGLIGGISQCVTSIIQYVYFSQHLDSPFKVSLYPAILVICLITSRLSKDRMRIRDGAGGRSL